jgi:hypothetical protein
VRLSPCTGISSNCVPPILRSVLRSIVTSGKNVAPIHW